MTTSIFGISVSDADHLDSGDYFSKHYSSPLTSDGAVDEARQLHMVEGEVILPLEEIKGMSVDAQDGSVFDYTAANKLLVGISAPGARSFEVEVSKSTVNGKDLVWYNQYGESDSTPCGKLRD